MLIGCKCSINCEDATNKLLTKTEGDNLTDAFENDDADYIAVANTLCIIHSTSRSILLSITCVLVGAESWQRGATKNGKVDDAKRQELMLLNDENPMLKR